MRPIATYIAFGNRRRSKTVWISLRCIYRRGDIERAREFKECALQCRPSSELRSLPLASRQGRFLPHAACASGDAPWCALTQLGEGAQAWDCHYGTVQECAPVVTAGNRGSYTPNPTTQLLRPPPPFRAMVRQTQPRARTANPRRQ